MFTEIIKEIKKGDYLYAKVADHPKATKKGYVLMHRVVMENYLGRYLNDNEIVHHVNEDKKDNRIENLISMTHSEHTALHAAVGRAMENLVCPECSKEFSREKRNTYLTKKMYINTFCSRSCNGKYSRRKQLSS